MVVDRISRKTPTHPIFLSKKWDVFQVGGFGFSCFLPGSFGCENMIALRA